MAKKPPPCIRLGSHCQELRLTVRISDLEEDDQDEQDASATWMTGHTQRITWGDPYVDDGILQVEATLHVPCRYLATNGKQATCEAHGFEGPIPRGTRAKKLMPLQLGEGRFSIVQRQRRRSFKLPCETPPSRSLPVLESENPCALAKCYTADNTKGAACCRDLTLEIDLPKAQKRLEALVRSRKKPYVCKVKREDEDILECEVISACGYLNAGDGVTCTLHGRIRPNGEPAKPYLCTEWPDELDDDETGHPGCVFFDDD